MCLIVDSNKFHNVFTDPRDPDFKYVRERLLGTTKRLAKQPPAKLVYGGVTMAQEYSKVGDALRFLLRLDQQGGVIRIPNKIVDDECVVVRNMGLCRSNDVHLIALARVSNVRLLCTGDRAAATDFANQRLISNPKGKVYQNASHKHLLRLCCCLEEQERIRKALEDQEQIRKASEQII